MPLPNNFNKPMPTIDALLADEFLVARKLIYLNHAAVAPWPARTAQAVQGFAQRCLESGAQHYRDWEQAEQGLREQLAVLIHAGSAEDIALLKSTSEALSVVSQGFPWRAGDNVVICAEEFPSNRIVWEALADRGVTVRPVPVQGAPDPEQELLTAFDARTRLLAVSSVQYAAGLRLDLARLGEACARRGVAFCVDAIQGLGAVPHDVGAMRIDFLMADAHKWLLGPEGVAVFYCRPEWRERLALHQFGWRMVEDPLNFERRDWQPAASARRFECGSPNMLGIHACAASLSLLLEIGADRTEQRILERSEYLFDSIARAPQLELITDKRRGRYAGIVAFRHRELPSPALFQRLLAHDVICSQRGGGIRFAPHCYNRLEDLERALRYCTA
jgi:selenocysteine lyase/cysteine desulfurase